MVESIWSVRAARFAMASAILIGSQGCGSNLPPNGAAGNPIDPVQAKEQGQSVADYYKKNPNAIQRAKPGDRR